MTSIASIKLEEKVSVPAHNQDLRIPNYSRHKSTDQNRPSATYKLNIYDSKKMLINEGDDTDTVYEVVDGTVMLFTISEDGRRTVVGFAQKGDYFGFVMRDVHSYFAQTTGTCVIRAIPRAKLWREIQKYHRIAEKFIALENNALENARKHMMLLTCKTPMERIAIFLLEMSLHQSAKRECARELRLPMTRTDIADYLGLVVETVCRCLTHLKEDGAISIKIRGRIEIVDCDKLIHYARGKGRCAIQGEIVVLENVSSTKTAYNDQTSLTEDLSSDPVAY